MGDGGGGLDAPPEIQVQRGPVEPATERNDPMRKPARVKIPHQIRAAPSRLSGASGDNNVLPDSIAWAAIRRSKGSSWRSGGRPARCLSTISNTLAWLSLRTVTHRDAAPPFRSLIPRKRIRAEAQLNFVHGNRRLGWQVGSLDYRQAECG